MTPSNIADRIAASMRLNHDLMRATALAGLVMLLANGATFVFYITCARSLGVALSGVALGLISFALMVSVPAAVLAAPLSNALGIARGAGDRATTRGILLEAGFVLAAVELIVLIAATAGRGPLSVLLRTEPMTATWTVIAIGANLACVVTRSLLQGIAANGVYAASGVIEAVGKLLAALAVTRAGLAVDDAIAGFALSLAAAALAGSIPLWGRLPDVVPRFDALRYAFRGSGDFMVTYAALAPLTFFDAVASRWFLSPFAAGLYNAAALAGRALMTVLAFAPSVVLPRLAERMSRAGETSSATKAVYLGTALVCFPAAVLFIALPHTVIGLVAGARYQDAASLVPLYGIAASALAAALTIAAARYGRGERALARLIAPIACAEIAGLLLFHADALSMVRVVAIGHVSVLVAVLAAPRREPPNLGEVAHRG